MPNNEFSVSKKKIEGVFGGNFSSPREEQIVLSRGGSRVRVNTTHYDDRSYFL